MNAKKWLLCLLVLFFALAPSNFAFAKRKAQKRRRYPPVTHPVVLWSRTVSESPDPEQRKVAAFKLSQYTQPIFQEEVINTLVKCMKDPEVHIKVFCAKAMGRAGTHSKNDSIRKHLLEQYRADPQLRSTLVRTFMLRKDNHPSVQEVFVETAKQSSDPDELIALLGYFESYGSNSFLDSAISIYEKTDNIKIKRAAVKALAERGQGQDSIINLLSHCTESKDTPLALTCLSGLRLQAKKDSKTWTAVEKTIQSLDPDVLMATLEVIHVLPETPNATITKRLVEIITDNDDTDMIEHALLALGVCGDFSESAVNSTQGILEKKDADEGLRISAALVLGKQATKFPENAKRVLSECKSSAKSQSLRTACQLGLQELEDRNRAMPAPVVAPSPITVKPSPTAEPRAKETVLPSPSPQPLATPVESPSTPTTKSESSSGFSLSTEE